MNRLKTLAAAVSGRKQERRERRARSTHVVARLERKCGRAYSEDEIVKGLSVHRPYGALPSRHQCAAEMLDGTGPSSNRVRPRIPGPERVEQRLTRQRSLWARALVNPQRTSVHSPTVAWHCLLSRQEIEDCAHTSWPLILPDQQHACSRETRDTASAEMVACASHCVRT